MAKIIDQEELANVNIIATGSCINGNLITEGDCRIDGLLKGNVSSKSKVIVGKTGIIEGNIQCEILEVEGRITGELHIKELLSLRNQSVVIGNLSVGKIAIEVGAEFEGNCKMLQLKSPKQQPIVLNE
ncbi:MAG: polymer-forming cytoskeletal protein [Bacteroidales bacterium]|jgi:cytoskeletal protein CcmA (bactofilin family)|nr:polymer-forming cytoskeletal protein [Bacteroidales bacterium]